MARNVNHLMKTLRSCGPRLHSTAIHSGSIKSTDIFDQNVEKYSIYQPTPISIAHFIQFGKTASTESSFLFLKREVPVRLANIMKELMLMPDELRKTRACNLVINQYRTSFQEIIAFENANKSDPKVLCAFTETLYQMRERHANIVPTMAEAVMEVKSNYKEQGNHGRGQLPRFGKNIQYFLDRLYTSRISLRMLINQHTLLFAEPDQVREKLRSMDDGKTKVMIGSLDPDCEVGEIVLQAYENARCLCEQYYMVSPDLYYEAFDATKTESSKRMENQIGHVGERNSGGQDPLHFVYIPSHLYHILFEIFKNAMRATIEQAGQDALHVPSVEVYAVKGHEDVTINVRDRGGGIPRRLMGNIFEYLYTTANPVITSSSDLNDYTISPPMMSNTVPLAGYGYGLPLSRLYARYFGGDLELYSAEGWGTNAVIYLHALAGAAKERLPIFHETGSKKIYEAQLAASDWTEVNVSSDRNRRVT